MTMNRSRREFLKRDVFTEVFRLAKEVVNSYEEEEGDYFDSFEKCYPLISEAGEMLIDEAIKHGIKTEGKSKPEIARQIFAASGLPRGRKGGEPNIKEKFNW
jgi:hypothetical protein